MRLLGQVPPNALLQRRQGQDAEAVNIPVLEKSAKVVGVNRRCHSALCGGPADLLSTDRINANPRRPQCV